MPHKKVRFVVPAWVDELEVREEGERCLYTIVVEALVAKNAAERRGALEYPKLAEGLRSADAGLLRVADGRGEGDARWKLAVRALRKYTQVLNAVDALKRREEGRAMIGARSQIRRAIVLLEEAYALGHDPGGEAQEAYLANLQQDDAKRLKRQRDLPRLVLATSRWSGIRYTYDRPLGLLHVFGSVRRGVGAVTARVVFRLDPTSDDPRVLVRRHGYLPTAQLESYRAATAGVRYLPKDKLHVASVDRLPGVLKRLREAGIDTLVTEAVAKLVGEHETTIWVDLAAAKERLVVLRKAMAKIGKGLYPFQTVGVEWLSQRYRALLGDEPGLGKSCMTLASLPPNAPVLVVCPAVVKGVWVREAALWRPTLSPQMLEGRASFRYPKPGEMVITNFDILPRCHKEDCTKKVVVTCDGCSPILPEAHLAGCKRGVTYCPGCVDLLPPRPGTVMIVDEAHNCKSRTTLRGESVRSLGNAVRAKGGRTWFLTGTPILNDPEELWSILESCDLAHEAFGSWKDFVTCFGGKVKTVEVFDKKKRQKVTRQTGYEWGEPSDDMVDRLQRVMLRRMRKDVMTDLPPMTIRHLPVDVSKASLKQFDKLLRDLGGPKALAELLARKKVPFEMVSAVRSALAMAKIPAMMSVVEQYEDMKEPLLVFSAHRAPIDLFLDREGWAVITGDTPAKERTQIEDGFQKGKYRGLAGTIAAAGVGITLTYACHELFVDEEWTPALNDQARGRALRHGQKRAVFVDVLVANHPLDQRIAEILIGKTTIIEKSVDAARETG